MAMLKPIDIANRSVTSSWFSLGKNASDMANPGTTRTAMKARAICIMLDIIPHDL
jgi:hypothetical protein